MRLLHQGEGVITIPEGGVPVIIHTSPMSDVAWAVNFLRCGCPAVQLSWVSLGVGWDRSVQKINDHLQALAMPDESFRAEPHEEKSVIIFTRKAKK